MSAQVFMHSKSSLWWEQTPALMPKSKAGAVIFKNFWFGPNCFPFFVITLTFNNSFSCEQLSKQINFPYS